MTSKRTLALLVASTTLTAAIGLPALGALRGPAERGQEPAVTGVDDARALPPLVVASDDDDDEGERRHAARDGDRHDECDDDDDCGRNGRAPAPAPTGPATPPRNGLFGTGAPPQVRVN
jgi:hypothetical protein